MTTFYWKSDRRIFFVENISMLLDIPPVNTTDPSLLLRRILRIQHMERGKLSIMRQGPEGPYYKLQCWENGRNFSRYVPRDQVPAVEEALEGYRLFRQLTDQYAQSVIDKTRAQLEAESNKLRYRRGGWRRRKKSNI